MTTADRRHAAALPAPSLTGLPDARDDLQPLLDRMLELEGPAHHNHQGGDLAQFRNERSLVRNLANYVAAADLARTHAPAGAVVDFGSGTGLLAGWLGAALSRAVTLVDADPRLLDAARRLLPGVVAHTSLDAVPARSVALLTAMEVIEHIEPGEQAAVMAALAERLTPGGLLVLSTPDEAGYLGGHSRYAPHIGPLTVDELARLLPAGPGWRTAVWRLEGPLHTLSPATRVLGPLGNAAWAALGRHAPALADAVAGRAAALSRRRPHRPLPAADLQVRAVPADQGTGDGLLAVAVRLAG